MTGFDPPLTVVELSLILVNDSLFVFDNFFTTVEASLTVIGEPLTAVDLLSVVTTGGKPSTVLIKCLGTLVTSPFLTVSTACSVPEEPISSIGIVFSGFCVLQLTLAAKMKIKHL